MPYEYAISFEIKSDATYGERYRSLIQEIAKTPGSTGFWAETTAFILIRSNEAIEDLEHRLYYKSKLLSSKDKLLVIDHVNNVAVARGPFEYPNTLKAHFKTCLFPK